MPNHIGLYLLGFFIGHGLGWSIWGIMPLLLWGKFARAPRQTACEK